MSKCISDVEAAVLQAVIAQEKATRAYADAVDAFVASGGDMDALDAEYITFGELACDVITPDGLKALEEYTRE